MIIGVIDSGVNREFLEEDTLILSDIQFVYMNSTSKVITKTEYNVSDLHGTMVINTMEKYKGDAANQYIVCNIYDESSVAHIEAVLEALRFLVNTNVEIAVISLTVPPVYTERCNQELRRLYEKGIKVFVSYSNESKESGLLNNKYVYGVDQLPVQATKKWLLKYSRGVVFADARPEFIPMGESRFSVFHGTSKANAIAAGRYSETRELKNTKKSKEQIEKIKFKADDVCRSKINNVYKEILESTNTSCEIKYEELSGETELSEIVPSIDDAVLVLQHIANRHKFSIDLLSLPVEMFKDLSGIEGFIEYHEKKAAGERIGTFRYKFNSFIHKYRIQTVLKECARYFKYNIFQILVSLLCSAVLFLTPIIEQHIVDDGIGSGSIRILLFWAGALVANAIIQKIFEAINTIVSVRIGNKIEMDLRSRLVERVASVKIDGYTTNDSGKLDSLIKSDFTEFNSIINTSVLNIVVSLFELSFATIMMLHYNALLGAVVFSIQVVSIFVISGQFDRLEKSNTYLRECFITQNRILNDIIFNIRWIRLIGAKEYLLNHFRSAMNIKCRQLERSTLLNVKISSFDNVISSFGSAIMYLLGGYLIINGNLTIGMLIGFMQYAGKFASPVSSLISEVSSYKGNIAAITDVCNFFEGTGARFISNQSRSDVKKVDCLEITDLYFSYEDNNILITL